MQIGQDQGIVCTDMTRALEHGSTSLLGIEL
jgi:hypothetical protein